MWHGKNTKLRVTVYFLKKLNNCCTVEIKISVYFMLQFILIVVSKEFQKIKRPYFSNESLIFQILFLCKLFMNILRKHQQLQRLQKPDKMFKDETRLVNLLILITSCGIFTDFFYCVGLKLPKRFVIHLKICFIHLRFFRLCGPCLEY